jgi:molybdopterin-guanine dinucleotide biosynthesis protein A
MGCDKAAMDLNGRTFLEIAIETLRPLVGTVYLVGGIHRYPGLSTLRDLVAGAGPLGGLLTALCASSATRLLVLAVDMPLVRTSTLRALLEAAPFEDITVACTPDGRDHPLCGAYSTRCMQPIREMLQRGRYRVDDLMHCPELAVRRIPCAELGCPPEEFSNINTPGELEMVRQRLALPPAE